MPDLSSARFGLPFLAAGQAQKELTHNEALALIDAGLSPAAEAIGTNAPPVSPVAGQCWIIGNTPSGEWVGQADKLACWTSGGWRFVPALIGMEVWLKDQQLTARREATAWVTGDLRGGRLLLDGEQVVGARLGSVTIAAGGGVIDAEARAALAAVIDRLVAHGLIGA